MKIQQSPYFYKVCKVEGYVLPEEWEQIVTAFNSKMEKYDCLDLSKVENINIPKNVFNSNPNLQEVVLPETLVTIEKSAFENCISLKRVIFPDTLKKIEASAFTNCNLEHFNAPKTLEYLGDNAFRNNRSLNNIQLNKNLAFLGKDVFLSEKDFVKAVPQKQAVIFNEKEL